MMNFILRVQSSALMDRPRQLSFSLYSLVAREPKYWFLYQPYLRWIQMKRQELGEKPYECTVLPDTELVIDGFQGSANSFATEAFQQSQTRPVKLAHHLHSPVQIIRAVQQNIPVWLTIREPAATVISLTSRWSHLSVNQGLRSYIGFYTKLQSYAADCVVSTFEQTTQHADQVVQTVNAKFNTNFDVVNVAQVNEKLKFRHSNPEELARRQPIKQAKQKELASPTNTKLLAKAEEVYKSYEMLVQEAVG